MLSTFQRHKNNRQQVTVKVIQDLKKYIYIYTHNVTVYVYNWVSIILTDQLNATRKQTFISREDTGMLSWKLVNKAFKAKTVLR